MTTGSLTGLETFQYYSSIKTHFNSKNYDYFKYGLNRKTFNDSSFNNRNDVYKFIKLSKMVNVSGDNNRTNLESLLFSWFFYKSDIWVGDIIDNPHVTAKYVATRARWRESPSQEFKTEFDNIFRTLDIQSHEDFEEKVLKCSGISPLINMMITRKISPEFVFVIDAIYDALNTFDVIQGTSPVWKITKLKLNKIKPLISFTVDQIGECVDYIKMKTNDNF